MTNEPPSDNPLKRKMGKAEGTTENPHKRGQERWKKRRSTCYRKLMELSQFCVADVYALIRRKGEIYTLVVTGDGSFPPPESELGGPKGKAKIADFQQREVRAYNLINRSQDVDKDRAKRDQEKWKNRRSTCYCKLMELSLYCGAEIYALVRRQGEIYTLNTADNPSFPPPESTLGGPKGKVEVADFQLREVGKPTSSATSDISRNPNKAKRVRAGKPTPSAKLAIQPPVWVTSPVERTLSSISAFDPPERLGGDESRFVGGDTLSMKRVIQPPIWMTSSVEKTPLDPPEHLGDDESQFVESGPCNNFLISSFDSLHNL